MSEPSALGALGTRLGRHTAVYATGTIITFVMGIANIAVLTRLLPIEEFGQLALLLLVAVLLTILYNLGTLQGTFRRVYGGSGEDDVDDDADAADVTRGQKREALGSALLMTMLVGACGTAILVPLSGPIADGLLHRPGQGTALALAITSAAFGAVWRLVINVLRYERRPAAFVALGAIRPTLILACSIVLVTSGHGLTGAVGGVALGTSLSVLVALVVTRRSYRLVLHPSHALAIFRAGAVFIPLVLSFWVLHNADLYLVSLFADDRQVALYRVASRIAAGVSYFISAFLMAWGPLTRTSLHQAVLREHGIESATSAIFTWFAFVCLWILLGLAVLADALIRIAPASYEDAAPLIPVLGFAFVAFGAFRICYRGAKLPDKRRTFVRLAVAVAIGFLVIGTPLVAGLGGYGAALSQILVLGAATGVLVALSYRNGTPLRLDWSRLLRALAVAAVLLGIGLAAGPSLGQWRIVVDLAAVAAFPLLLVLTGAVGRDDVRALRIALASLRPRRDRAGTALRAIAPSERLLLARLVRDGEPVADVARAEGVDEPTLLRRAVAALRVAAGAGEPHRQDVRLGRYLLMRDAVAERDVLARTLWRSDISALDIDALENLVAVLRRAPARVWESAAAVPGESLALR